VQPAFVGERREKLLFQERRSFEKWQLSVGTTQQEEGRRKALNLLGQLAPKVPPDLKPDSLLDALFCLCPFLYLAVVGSLILPQRRIDLAKTQKPLLHHGLAQYGGGDWS
jgi:hypothetical protein